MKIKVKEEQRRTLALIIAHTGWWGALILLGVNIGLGGQRPIGHAPPWLGLIIVVLIGIGIAGGTSLARMRLARTIMRAFDEGYRARIDGRAPNYSKDNKND